MSRTQVATEETAAAARLTLESVLDCALAVQNYAMQHPEDENSVRLVGQREAAHRQAQCHSPLNGRQRIFALLGYEDVRSLEGRLLTIMDASFTDREQRKAAKDLVRNAIWFDWVANLDMDGNGGKPDLRA